MQFKKNILLALILLTTLSVKSQETNVSGTTGTPIGGIGAGAVKYNANNGTFAIMTRPPADAYDFKPVKNAKFQLYTRNSDKVQSVETLKAVTRNGYTADDAIWPVHRVDFGQTNGIRAELCGYSPFDNQNYNNMSLPYALYEMQLSNENKNTTEVAIALQWSNENSSYVFVKNKGIQSENSAVYTSTNAKGAKITTGKTDETSFLNTGACDNNTTGSTAKVAVKLTLRAGEKKSVYFVIAWYESCDPELAYYFNLFPNAAGVAEHGVQVFQRLKSNALTLADTFRASGLPAWLKNQTMNTLANLTTNSMYKKDGRFAFAEGQWTCFGTMDQMWHARQIIGQLLPYFAWQELRYWARTQMKNGQIHHDHNLMDVGPDKEKRSLLVSWDDTEHTDYRKIEKWVDLNAAMIISTYEIYQITGDRNEFNFLWPYLKKAAQRILDQANEYGNQEFPYTFDHSENSYDAGGDPNPFNAGIATVAFKIMSVLAEEKNEKQTAETYSAAFKTAVKSFEGRYLNNEGFNTVKHSESYYSGQWLAFHLKMGEIWSVASTDFVLNKLDSYYHPFYLGLGYEKGTYDEWTPYILTHYGGLLLNTHRANQWYVMQKDASERQYLNKDFVFNHPLNILPKVHTPKNISKNISSDKQYISMPAIWRNYYDLAGYYRDKRTNELWLKPLYSDSLETCYKNIPVFTPEGICLISCSFSGEQHQNKEITFVPEKQMPVSKLYLEDNFGENVAVIINNRKVNFRRTGTGYSKEIVIDLSAKVNKKGIKIDIKGDKGAKLPAVPPAPVEQKELTPQKTITISAYTKLEVENATKTEGVRIEKSTGDITVASSCNNFDYIHFANVDFGPCGVSEIVVTAATPLSGVGIEIVLDDVAGELIGTCDIKNTGSYQNYTESNCILKQVNGVRNVYLRFTGTSSENLLNLDKISFKEKDNTVK